MPAFPVLHLAIFFAVGWLIYALGRLYKQRTWFCGLPQPPRSFIWGHLKIMGEVANLYPPNTHYQILLTTIAQKYNLPPIWYLDLWPLADSFVVVTDPALIQQTATLPKHALVDTFLNSMVGRNTIVAIDGPLWKKLHNIMQPAFTWSSIRSLLGLVVEETVHFRNSLDKFARSGETFSMADLSTNLIYDITGQVVFDQKLHAQAGGSLTAHDIHEISRLSEASMTWNPIKRMLITLRRQFVTRRVDDLMRRKITERWAVLKGQKGVPAKKEVSSILDLMLREHLLQHESSLSKDDLHIEESRLLVSNLKGLMIGGHGTTADLLSFIFLLLSKFPQVVHKLRDEHNEVFGSDVNETSAILRASPTRLHDLRYTTAVIYEVMRLFPAGISARDCGNMLAFAYDGHSYPIHSNLAVVANVHTLHYSDPYFHAAAMFSPERFMEYSAEKAKNELLSPWSLAMPFGIGKRACLAQNLALEELKVILLMTMRLYDFECAEVPNVKPRADYTQLDTLFGNVVFQQFGISARPAGDVLMRVKRRMV